MYCSRSGGDEFVIVYKNQPEEILKEIARKIRDGIHEKHIPHEYSKASSIVTLSQGTFLSSFDKQKDFSKYMHNADAVLYEVKEKTRDSYLVRSDL